jgi:hypothetical protein
MTSGFPASQATAARDFIRIPRLYPAADLTPIESIDQLSRAGLPQRRVQCQDLLSFKSFCSGRSGPHAASPVIRRFHATPVKYALSPVLSSYSKGIEK